VTSIPLFRAAAVDSTRTNWLGQIVIVRPLSLSILTIAGILVFTMIICFIFFCSYTSRSSIAGQLVPNMGVTKVYARQSGVIVKKYIYEGKFVKKGEVLYLISNDRQASTDEIIDEKISRHMALRRKYLNDELINISELNLKEKVALQRKIRFSEEETKNLSLQLTSQLARINLSEKAMQRFDRLYESGYISAESFQQKQIDFLELQNRSQVLERDLIQTRNNLAMQRGELNSLPLHYRSQVTQIEKLITSMDQELTENEAKRSIAVVAPRSGTATAIAFEIGQTVELGKLLVSIVPEKTELEARLYLPSRAIGFIRQGTQVWLRYQAYPYQKFGHSRGVIKSISKTTLLASELSDAKVFYGNNLEPLYQVTVTIGKQEVIGYGKIFPLQAGMLVDADLMHDQRKLYEWILDPLYSLTGKI
jgi:membrane fusion protein